MCCWQHKAHAVCCTFFSLISAIILLFLGELIKNQPEFHVTQFPNGTEEPAKRLFGAAGMYMGTMVISLAFWVRHNKMTKHDDRHAYHRVLVWFLWTAFLSAFSSCPF